MNIEYTKRKTGDDNMFFNKKEAREQKDHAESMHYHGGIDGYKDYRWAMDEYREQDGERFRFIIETNGEHELRFVVSDKGYMVGNLSRENMEELQHSEDIRKSLFQEFKKEDVVIACLKDIETPLEKRGSFMSMMADGKLWITHEEQDGKTFVNMAYDDHGFSPELTSKTEVKNDLDEIAEEIVPCNILRLQYEDMDGKNAIEFARKEIEQVDKELKNWQKTREDKEIGEDD